MHNIPQSRLWLPPTLYVASITSVPRKPFNMKLRPAVWCLVPAIQLKLPFQIFPVVVRPDCVEKIGFAGYRDVIQFPVGNAILPMMGERVVMRRVF